MPVGPGPVVRWPGGAGTFWIDGEGAGARVSVKGFTTHLSGGKNFAVTVARSDLRIIAAAAAGSTVREGGPPVPAASSDPGYEGLVTVDGGFIYRHDGSRWVRAPLVFGSF